MKYKCFLSVILIITLLCACAACGAAPTPADPTPPFSPSPASLTSPPPKPSPTPTVFPTAQDPEPLLDGDDFPSVIDIPVTREGETEIMTGTLRVSDLGYAIYLLPDFIFTPGDDGDVIHPSEDSPLLSTITMKIAPVSADTAVPENYENDGLRIVYERVTKDGKTFEVQFTYPFEAAEGGAVLLRAMWETLTTDASSLSMPDNK